MSKRQLVEEIVAMNQTALPEFLAQFGEEDLQAYLRQLRLARSPRLTGDAQRYSKYFQARQSVVLTNGRPQASAEAVEQAERNALLAPSRPMAKVSDSAITSTQATQTPVATDPTQPLAADRTRTAGRWRQEPSQEAAAVSAPDAPADVAHDSSTQEGQSEQMLF